MPSKNKFIVLFTCLMSLTALGAESSPHCYLFKPGSVEAVEKPTEASPERVGEHGRQQCIDEIELTVICGPRIPGSRDLVPLLDLHLRLGRRRGQEPQARRGNGRHDPSQSQSRSHLVRASFLADR